VVDQIRDDQWDSRVPDDLSPRQPGATLRQIVNYHAHDDAWVPMCSTARPWRTSATSTTATSWEITPS